MNPKAKGDQSMQTKWLLICTVAIILGFVQGQCSKVLADDYSNDFEFQMEQEFDNPPPDLSIVKGFDIIDPSPSQRVFDVIERQKQEKYLDKVYNREKYTYRPYSPNKRQHREMTKTDD